MQFAALEEKVIQLQAGEAMRMEEAEERHRQALAQKDGQIMQFRLEMESIGQQLERLSKAQAAH